MLFVSHHWQWVRGGSTEMQFGRASLSQTRCSTARTNSPLLRIGKTRHGKAFILIPPPKQPLLIKEHTAPYCEVKHLWGNALLREVAENVFYMSKPVTSHAEAWSFRFCRDALYFRWPILKVLNNFFWQLKCMQVNARYQNASNVNEGTTNSPILYSYSRLLQFNILT